MRSAGKFQELINKAEEIHRNYRERASTMNVSEITFTRFGTFIVGFESQAPYVGEWHWEDQEHGIFTCYFLMDGDNGEPVKVETTGQIRFDAQMHSDITIDASFTCEGKLYDAVVDFVCEKAI